MVAVGLAGSEHLVELAQLFDQYRIFYQQDSDLEAAQAFLSERFCHRDSVILVASDQQAGERLVGFVQLYPSFSSVSMRRIWILNDLFVQPSHRGQGVGRQLLDAAEQYARETGAIRVVLETQVSNLPAQALYESRGYVRDKEFYGYALSL